MTNPEHHKQYYSEKLAAEWLRESYHVAPARIKRYLAAETGFVGTHVPPVGRILELSCGRALAPFADAAGRLCGIDRSESSLQFGKRMTPVSARLCAMNAAKTGFKDNSFTLACCIQNGISAFGIPPGGLIKETARIVKSGGTALFSTYSENIWEARLDWFRLQAAAGLIGEIDGERTGNGVIACKDGFRAVTFTAESLRSHARDLNITARVTEGDKSALFLIISV